MLIKKTGRRTVRPTRTAIYKAEGVHHDAQSVDGQPHHYLDLVGGVIVGSTPGGAAVVPSTCRVSPIQYATDAILRIPDKSAHLTVLGRCRRSGVEST